MANCVFPTGYALSPIRAGLVANVLAGVASLRRQRPEVRFALLSSADIPLLTGAIVSDFIRRCLPLEKGIYYNFVPAKADMERRFPGSNARSPNSKVGKLPAAIWC
jgi:hypothetical protein